MKLARFALVFGLFISFSIFGFAEKVSASSPLSIHIANNNLYIDSCSLNLPVVTGYKGYVGAEEIYSTGPSGGFPCYSGDLFIQNLSSFYYLNTSSPFTSRFDFYTNSDFNSPILKTFTLQYDSSSFSVFDDSTRIVSLGVSTTKKTVFVQNYISQNEVGSIVNFTISSSSPENIIFSSDQVSATTTGDFLYSWTYPDLQGGNDYIFTTNIASTTVLKSTSTVVSLPAPLSGNSNVLFIPGLEASRLYEKKTILGIPVEDQLWEPNIPNDVDALYLDNNGDSINKNIYTKDVIGTSNVLPVFTVDVYKSLIVDLDNLVLTNKINNWKAYAYDWRQGIDDLIKNGTKYNDDQVITLTGTLNSLVNSSQNGKVTVIAHSNGGLVAKALIKKLEDMKSSGQSDLIDHIDNLILVASPQIGTPDAFSALLHGYKQSFPYKLMSEVQARKLTQNMPSVYGLLPSKKYFEQTNIKSLAAFASTSSQIYQNIYGVEINNYSEEYNFVLGQEGRTQPAESDLAYPIKGNSLLLSQADTLHDLIDNMAIPASIRVINIAGWGKETLAGITYSDSDIQPIYTLRGDHTVVSASALYGQGDKYWLDLSNSKLDHKNILEDSQLLDFINNVIDKKPLAFSLITETEPYFLGDRLHFGVHSPVSIGVYDNQGNFTGKVCDDVANTCVIQENIPGSTYYEFGEGKYVNLGAGNLHKVILQGTGVGTFTFNVDKVSPNDSVVSSYFIDIPVTTQTQAEITVDQNTGVPLLKLDVTGDGVTDFTLSPNTAFDPITYLQIFKTTVDSLDITNAQKKSFDTKIDNIIKLIQKGKVDKASITADKFASALQKSVSAKGSKNPKSHQLSKTDAQLLLDMLNTLLDNIG